MSAYKVSADIVTKVCARKKIDKKIKELLISEFTTILADEYERFRDLERENLFMQRKLNIAIKALKFYLGGEGSGAYEGDSEGSFEDHGEEGEKPLGTKAIYALAELGVLK